MHSFTTGFYKLIPRNFSFHSKSFMLNLKIAVNYHVYFFRTFVINKKIIIIRAYLKQKIPPKILAVVKI